MSQEKAKVAQRAAPRWLDYLPAGSGATQVLGLPTRRERALKHYEEIEKLVGEKGQAGTVRKLGVTRQCVHGCLVKLAGMRGEG